MREKASPANAKRHDYATELAAGRKTFSERDPILQEGGGGLGFARPVVTGSEATATSG
jgi:hypothetical protein